ncbi:hypothetical protein EIK76_00245 [Rheinheimera mesophila]|uniref:Uncharacterized protein n=1 Tax=Rheinheimera mesophila TaxID=1547515 RepID=A0A3P3QMW8_9GAMM|nr:hypothetical protein [Rheinheimera mesophila]KKL00277.1 hypothetical protein SD53_15900 [Rheinheimera mesophila]RRJ22551.1 hypothetical protein EIK76_00245 [Rheinheimera mesophila]
MINGITLTAQEALQQFSLPQLIGRKCVVVAQAYGNGSVDMVFGEIADPAACEIDEEKTAALFVEYQANDDWHIVDLEADAPLVLLEETA